MILKIEYNLPQIIKNVGEYRIFISEKKIEEIIKIKNWKNKLEEINYILLDEYKKNNKNDLMKKKKE